MSKFRHLAVSAVCLAFTGSHVAWGDPAPPSPSRPSLGQADYIEDPYAPHDTSGTEARLGTTVGFVYGERIPIVTAVGASLAVGQRFGRFAIEGELDHLMLQAYGASDLRLGSGDRLNVIARYDVARLGSRYVGGNSLAALYVEGGVGVAWNRWFKPGFDEPERTVPDDSKRPEGTVGIGISIDHRLQEPITFPRRIGWFLGWRESFAPHAAESASICRGSVSCRAAPMMPEASYTDRAMLFQSSMVFTW